MNKSGPILIIDDDSDDRQFLQEAIREAGYDNEIIEFDDGDVVIKYLSGKRILPFLIFCDINMPKLNGLELRRMIQEDIYMRDKSIPFLFFSTSASPETVHEAYTHCAQGFFMKPNSYALLLKLITNILTYWKDCYSPGSFSQVKSDKA